MSVYGFNNSTSLISLILSDSTDFASVASISSNWDLLIDFMSSNSLEFWLITWSMFWY